MERTTVIVPSAGWSAIDLRELWAYRDVLWVLAGRDIKLRYKQTAIGVLWVVLQPLAAALIFAVIFGRLAHLPADGRPYILFVFCGLLAWNLFSQIITRGGLSLIADARLIQKVYFPRLLIPLASTGACLLDFAVTLVVMAVLMAIYATAPGWHLVALPLFLLFTLIGATGVALWLAGLNVRYRDFSYALPFAVQIWLFASPVAYAGRLVPANWRWAYSLNPAVGYIEGFRWSILGSSTLTWGMAAITAGVSLAIFLSGALVFKRIERGFADVV